MKSMKFVYEILLYPNNLLITRQILFVIAPELVFTLKGLTNVLYLPEVHYSGSI